MGGKNSENHEFFFIISLIIFTLLLWYLKEHFEYVATVWRCLRETQTYLFSVLPTPILDSFPALKNIDSAYEFISKTNAADISPSTVLLIDSFISTYIHILTGIALICVGYYKNLKNTEQSTKYEMENLLKRQSTLYPQIMQYNKRHPEHDDIKYIRGDKKSIANAASVDPSEFALMVPPIGLEEESEKNESLLTSIWDGEEIFNEFLAKRAFEVQLGNRYYGVESLNAHELKLYNILRSKIVFDYDDILKTVKDYLEIIVNKRRAPRDMLNSEQELFNKLKDYCSIVQKKGILKDKSMKKHEILAGANVVIVTNDKKLEKTHINITAERVMAKHAFIRTGLSSLLQEARKTGVLPAKNFRWMKGVDRTLWYVLSNLGRKVAFVECAGIHAHWLVEKEANTAIPIPEITEAINGLRKALQIEADNG